MSSLTYTSDIVHNTLTSTYGFDVNRHFSSKLKFELLKKYTNKDTCLLDAGCANGIFSLAIAPFCKEVYGIDINEKFLIEADKHKKDNTFFRKSDICKLEFMDKKFDVTYSYSTLLLVEKFKEAIAECKRVTKSNGILIFDITCKFNLSYMFWKKWYKKQGHHAFHGFSLKQIKNILKQHKLDIIELHSLGFIDQIRYLPFINRVFDKIKLYDKIVHNNSIDIDYKVSSLFPFNRFANRWYIVCRKNI